MKSINRYSVVLMCIALCFSQACDPQDKEPVYNDPIQGKFPGPQHGTGWEEYSFSYNIHKPWNLDLNERYTFNKDSNEHAFMILKDDEPFKEGDTTSPRCEMRILNDYTEGNHQFEADFFVYSKSSRPVIMQIFGYPLAINIKAYDENGGTLKWFDSHNITTNIYNRWMHLNVVHMFNERSIYVYVDGKQRGSFRVKEDAPSYYFKCGVYTCMSDTSKVKIKNIKCYKQIIQ